MNNTQQALKDFRDLMLAAIILRIYGKDDLAVGVEQVALRINDGTLEVK